MSCSIQADFHSRSLSLPGSAKGAGHGGNVWALARARGIPPDQILDFSADLNPWARDWVPASVVGEAWAQVRHYPDPAYHRFRRAAADWEGVEPENILPGNGTADLIHLISRWRKGARALIPVPTFTEYARAVRADGGEGSNWLLPETEGFIGRAFPSHLRGETGDLVFLCNPNNPTGTLWPRQTVEEILALCERKSVLLVVDEAYMELVPDERRYSLSKGAAREKSLLILRSMTKAFGVPGLRLGYAVGHSSVIEQLQEFQPPWALNTLGAEVGTWLLKSAAQPLADSRRKLESARLELERALNRFGLRVFPSHSNFLLCRTLRSVCALALDLEKEGILIRRCDDFEGLEPDRFFRAAVLRPEENQRLLRALEEALHAG